MDVEKWLHSLELQQYAATFRANGIDAEVLPELTDADLEKLGVVPQAENQRRRGPRLLRYLRAPAPSVAN